jgi:hypothetical protein
VRLGSSTVGKLPGKVDGAVEAQGTVGKDVNVESLEISWGVDDANVTSLNKVISDDNVLLIRSDLDVVRAEGGLSLVGVVKTDDIVEVADVESGDVVTEGEGEVGILSVGSEVRAVSQC